MEIKSEDLAYWFLRLNGFLTIQNFVVHPDTGANQRTDVDILGVRFPHRQELVNNPMDDYELFRQCEKSIIVLTEVKRGKCNLNGPWTERNKENIHQVLYALGTHQIDKVEEVAEGLYERGNFADDRYYISLISIGKESNDDLKNSYSNVPQILFDDILKFIFNRFSDYQEQKSHHPQWDENGKELWNTFQLAQNSQQFIQYIQIE